MAGLQELLVEPATVVTTAAELKDAVAAGVPHIEIRQHLDLRDGAPGNPMPVDPALLAGAGQLLPLRRLQDAGQKLPVLGTVSDTLRAIRGNCTPSGAVYVSYEWQVRHASGVKDSAQALSLRLDLLDAIADMIGEPAVAYTPESRIPCILHLDAGLLVAHSQLWLDGLHLEVHPAGAAVPRVIETSPAQPLRPQPLPPALWMTDVAVVGNIQPLGGERLGSVRGLRTVGTTVLLENCAFSGLGGLVPGHGSMSPVDIIGSTAAIVKCTFAGNFIASETEGVIRGDPGSIVVLQTPIFTNNAGPGQLLLGDHGMMGNRTSALRTIFSDDAEVTNYCQDGTAIVSMLGPGQEPPDARSELGSMEEWLRGSRSVAGIINRAARLTLSGSLEGDSTAGNSMGWCGSVPGSGAPGTTEGEPGAGLPTTVTAAAAAISAVLLLIMLTGCWLWHRRRRKRSAEMRMRSSHARNDTALIDWMHSSSKAAGTSSSHDRDGSELGGGHGKGQHAASVTRHDKSAGPTVPPSAAATSGGAAAGGAGAGSQAGTQAAGHVDKATYRYSMIQGKQGAPAFAGAGMPPSMPLRVDDGVVSERVCVPFHPPTDVQTFGSSITWATLPMPTQAAPLRPGAGAPVKERLAYIGKQLDAFGRRGVILKQFEMLGGDDRCIGGQAMVQFVRAPQNNHLYAIKLFASRAAYDDEKHLYVNFFPGFMPTVVQFVDNEDGRFTDPFGSPMAPCIVMEKGESLTERTKRCNSDIFTTVQIIGQVASCLAELHGHGWVHRDLKPGNIMYLPRTASWTLIDFGLAARAGETARLGYTLAYAAPEVIAAADIGSKSVTADTAVDAWALGVMAFELLTGRPVHCPLTGSPADLKRQLLGEEPLPWEGDRLTADTKRRLGAIRAPVLRMLCRDPVHRASCKDVAAALRAVFSGASTADIHDGGIHALPR